VLYLNNAYLGVYQLTEAIKIDANRVTFSKTISATNPNGGYILELDTRKGEVFNFTTTKGVVFTCSDPDEALDVMIPGDTKTLFEKIKDDVQHVEDVLYSANFKDPDEGYRKYIDVDSFVDWYLVEEITENNDSRFGALSNFLYYDPDKKQYCMGPLWDFDLALGNYKNVNETPNHFYIKNYSWTARLFQDPYFVSRVQDRWNNKKNEVNALLQYIDKQALYLDHAQNLNFQKWTINDTAGAAVVKGSYQGGIDYLKSWLAQKMAWLDTAINDL
jgi:hypothetical protein